MTDLNKYALDDKDKAIEFLFKFDDIKLNKYIVNDLSNAIKNRISNENDLGDNEYLISLMNDCIVNILKCDICLEESVYHGPKPIIGKIDIEIKNDEYIVTKYNNDSESNRYI